ncbi:hypothetical protein GCM10023340_21010 [Nocardioides marinquilinus]|uniref:Uncharacterized protein n=1 Tax=Nocardioides marinquilinus TaxID=1210400 RepID=A0ABP9PL51_9ACTN
MVEQAERLREAVVEAPGTVNATPTPRTLSLSKGNPTRTFT